MIWGDVGSEIWGRVRMICGDVGSGIWEGVKMGLQWGVMMRQRCSVERGRVVDATMQQLPLGCWLSH